MESESNDPFRNEVRSFYEDFSIDAYLSLRKKYPNKHIPIFRLGGLDYIFILDEWLKDFNINGLLIAGVMDADHESIDKLCLKLLKYMASEETLKKTGASHLASRRIVPTTSMISYLVLICFEAMERYDEPMNVSSLNFLLQKLLASGVTELEKGLKKQEFRLRVIGVGASLVANSKTPSMRQVASILGVAPSTVSRLFNGPADFALEARSLKELRERISGKPFLDSYCDVQTDPQK
jgi:hypothetical protein